MTWWQRQRLALTALAVAAVAVVGVHVWLDVLPAAESSTQIMTAENGRAEIAGQTLTLSSVRWGEFEAPDGSRTMSIRLDSDGGPDAESCGLFTLAEVEGDRVWSNARTGLDVPYDAGASYCQEESGPYVILAVFVLPDGVDGPFQLEVPGADRSARFAVDP
ncbi:MULTISPECIES: hypothetical protein [unclassified Microbacterium]|uniref:hypothetical protein n=1 Tax=unclassified Microbacterium TaxID=2609290 RepID=UPI0011C472CE|nr:MULTISPECIES: hypothetical protein [unclassified Microbacterium]MBT2483473.1 hypothetical protein [Microbacterium sp. ISL-108]